MNLGLWVTVTGRVYTVYDQGSCMKASEVKKGAVFKVDNRTIMVKGVQVQSPSSRSGSTLYKVRGRDVVSKQKFEASYKGDETLQDVDLVRRLVQFLFRDGDGCTFMDVETYDQYTLSDEVLEDEIKYLSDGLEGIYALIVDDLLMGIELPTTVALTIVETSPSIKGASASARTKPATLSTGLVVQVPEYISSGEVIKVNSDSDEFVSRA